jgi:hypothetical protein
MFFQYAKSLATWREREGEVYLPELCASGIDTGGWRGGGGVGGIPQLKSFCKENKGKENSYQSQFNAVDDKPTITN